MNQNLTASASRSSRNATHQRPASSRPTAGVSGQDGIFVVRGDYPRGGISEVLEKMEALVEASVTKPYIQRRAMQLTDGIPADLDTGHPDRRNRTHIARALYNELVARIAYVHDPHGIEQLQSAETTLELRKGDCDDMTVLASTLLGALGVPTRFVAIGTDASQPSAYTHVYNEYRTRAGKWRPFDLVIEEREGAQVPPSRVTVRKEHKVREGGIEGLATLAGAQAWTIAGPDAWLQFTGRSHKGSVPGDQQFSTDVYVKRNYDWFASCDVIVVAKDAESGEVLAESSVVMSKWTTNDCWGNGRLTFPLAFQPAETPVVLEVYDTDAESYDAGNALGTSGRLFLTEAAVQKVDQWWSGIGEEAGDVYGLLKWGVPMGLGLAGLFVARPYIEDVTSYGEDDE